MSVQKAHELKQLQSRKYKLEADAKAATEAVREAQQKQSLVQKQLKSVNDQIAEMSKKKSEIIVTEHAMLRFLERAQGVDLEHLQELILSEETRALIETLGNGKYPIGNGVKAIVKDRKVVSVA